MTLEDRLRARIDTLQANMERYAERMTDWQANAECAAELDALRQAQALLHALLVVIMKPSIKAHLLRYDPMALKQAMDAIEGGGAVEPRSPSANYERLGDFDNTKYYGIDGHAMQGIAWVMCRLYDESKPLTLDNKRDLAQRLDAHITRAEDATALLDNHTKEIKE